MTLRPPFACLTADNQLGFGDSGVVFEINEAIALKVPICFQRNTTLSARDLQNLLSKEAENVASIEREKAIYDIIASKPHPNLLQCILCAPEGIFLHRQLATLRERLVQDKFHEIKENTRIRWSREITSAASWLEELGLAHGDLRPSNIFLDRNDHVKLGDFDCAVKIGEDLRAFVSPFWKYSADGSFDKAGARTEQFALGSCMYIIFTGVEPQLDIDRDFAKINPEVIAHAQSVCCGSIILKCWKGAFQSIRELSQQVGREFCRNVAVSMLGICLVWIRSWLCVTTQAKVISQDELSSMRDICENFLRRERRLGVNIYQEQQPSGRSKESQSLHTVCKRSFPRE